MYRRLTLLLFAITSVTVICETPLPSDFLNRLAALGQHQYIHGCYTQIRHMSSLDMDFEFKGVMAAEQGGRLLWRADSPLKYVCIMSPEKLVQWDGESQKTITVSASLFPWLGMLYECQSAWISGDVSMLSKIFDISVSADSHGLVLIPKEPKVKNLFSKMEMSFNEDFTAVSSIILHEAGGDLLTIRFHHVQYTSIPPELWQIPPK